MLPPWACLSRKSRTAPKEDEWQEVEEQTEQAAELAPLLDADAEGRGDLDSVLGQYLDDAGAGLFSGLVARAVGARYGELVTVNLDLLDLDGGGLGHGNDLGEVDVFGAVGRLEKGEDDRDYSDDDYQVDETASHTAIFRVSPNASKSNYIMKGGQCRNGGSFVRDDGLYYT